MQPGTGKEIDPNEIPIVTVQWAVVPRSAEWTDLWRRILVDVVTNNEDVVNAAAPELHKPVDVNTPDQIGRCNDSNES
jgi:hypothetical protein